MGDRKHQPEKKEEKICALYQCSACQQVYQLPAARKQDFACCGEQLQPLEI